MSSSPFIRWSLDRVITRQKRLFGLLLTLGFLSGIAFCFAPLLQWRTATGSVHIRTKSLPCDVTPLFTPTELTDGLLSDEVLERTALALHLSEAQQVGNEEFVARLRTNILCRQVPATHFVEVSVNGSNRAEADKIWYSLISSANDHFRTRHAELKQTRLAAIALEIENKTTELEIKSKAFRKLVGNQEPDDYYNPLDLRGPSRGFIKVLNDRADAQQALDDLKLKQVSEQLSGTLIEDPVIIHQSPAARDSIVFSGILRSLTFAATLGLAGGMILAIVLAYLLESISPRKPSASA